MKPQRRNDRTLTLGDGESEKEKVVLVYLPIIEYANLDAPKYDNKLAVRIARACTTPNLAWCLPRAPVRMGKLANKNYSRGAVPRKVTEPAIRELSNTMRASLKVLKLLKRE